MIDDDDEKAWNQEAIPKSGKSIDGRFVIFFWWYFLLHHNYYVYKWWANKLNPDDSHEKPHWLNGLINRNQQCKNKSSFTEYSLSYINLNRCLHSYLRSFHMFFFASFFSFPSILTLHSFIHSYSAAFLCDKIFISISIYISSSSTSVLNTQKKKKYCRYFLFSSFHSHASILLLYYIDPFLSISILQIDVF